MRSWHKAAVPGCPRNRYRTAVASGHRRRGDGLSLTFSHSLPHLLTAAFGTSLPFQDVRVTVAFGVERAYPGGPGTDAVDPERSLAGSNSRTAASH